MAGIADRIRGIQTDLPASGTPPLQAGSVQTPQLSAHDEGIIPWLWIAAWLIGWALLLAIAAWWIGRGDVGGREVWMWVMVWAIPGLVVSALIVRSASQAAERAFTLGRLSKARSEIVQLETQLQASTQSMFAATRTLTDATEILLEQVDTSRDDLRNQITSAQSLAEALRTQTEGLVSARSSYLEKVRGEIAPAPQSGTPEHSEPLASVIRSVTEDIQPPPPLGLRPGPEAEDTFEPSLDISEPIEPGSVSATATDDKSWQWKDMLSNVDADMPASNDGETVVSLLKAQGLAPDAIVDGGNALDALGTWEKAGLPAMGQLLSIRFDEPARAFKAYLDTDTQAQDTVARFSETRASRLALASEEARRSDAATETGRAWLFVQAVLAL